VLLFLRSLPNGGSADKAPINLRATSECVVARAAESHAASEEAQMNSTMIVRSLLLRQGKRRDWYI
jgi:hypothetical protein